MLLDRRTAIQWIVAASAALQAPSVSFAAAATPVSAVGYGKDADLLKAYQAGDLWPLTLTAEQRKLATVLCDLMIPAEGDAPGAAALGVVDFIDEWISAPYPDGQRDRTMILEGFAWLDQQARSRFGKQFATIDPTQRASICDPLTETRPPSALTQAAAFFFRYRDLTAIGFYTTPIGTADLGYRGNVPLATYDGPPAEVLARLKL